MIMRNMQITKERWEWILKEVSEVIAIGIVNEYTELTLDELTLVESVLIGNTPFEVCETSHVVTEKQPFNVVEKSDD